MKYPIQRTIVSYGHDYIRTLDKGEVVKCWYCGDPITINDKTVYPSPADQMPIVCCSNCFKRAPVLYYFDRVINPEAENSQHGKKKKRKKSDRPYNRTVDMNRNNKRYEEELI